MYLPHSIKKQTRVWNVCLGLFAFLELVAVYLALCVVGTDTDQGNVYRILFIHVVLFFGFLEAPCLVFSGCFCLGKTSRGIGVPRVRWNWVWCLLGWHWSQAAFGENPPGECGGIGIPG